MMMGRDYGDVCCTRFVFFFFSLISLAVLFAVGVEFVAEIEVGV